MRAFAAGYAALVCQAMAIASATQGVLGFLRTAAPSASRPARAALVPHRLQVVPRPDYVSSVATLLTHLSLLRTSSPVGHTRGDICALLPSDADACGCLESGQAAHARLNLCWPEDVEQDADEHVYC